jgi:hypothetical protein
MAEEGRKQQKAMEANPPPFLPFLGVAFSF